MGRKKKLDKLAELTAKQDAIMVQAEADAVAKGIEELVLQNQANFGEAPLILQEPDSESRVVEAQDTIVVTQADADAVDKLENVEQVLKGTEVEQQLIQDEKQKLEQFMQNEEEMASLAIKLYTPRFRAAVDKLGARAAKRLLKSLIEYPLKDYKHTDEDEKMAFGIGQALMDSKMILIFHTFNANKEKIFDKMAEAEVQAKQLAETAKTDVIFNQEEGVNNG